MHIKAGLEKQKFQESRVKQVRGSKYKPIPPKGEGDKKRMTTTGNFSPISHQKILFKKKAGNTRTAKGTRRSRDKARPKTATRRVPEYIESEKRGGLRWGRHKKRGTGLVKENQTTENGWNCLGTDNGCEINRT